MDIAQLFTEDAAEYEKKRDGMRVLVAHSALSLLPGRIWRTHRPAMLSNR
jgi:hypothetical protein